MSLLTPENAMEASKREAMLNPFSVETSGLTWMVVHGMMCLALRHPAYKGPSRALAINFVQTLGSQLVEWGVLKEEELKEAMQVEQIESPHRDTI